MASKFRSRQPQFAFWRGPGFCELRCRQEGQLMFAGLAALLFGVSGLNVVNSYVGRNFMTAIAERQTPEFIRQAIFYVGVFAALTVVSVIARFVEERLALLWREFITRRAVTFYLANGTYYRLDVSGQLTNPDQRIAMTFARSPLRRFASSSWCSTALSR